MEPESRLKEDPSSAAERIYLNALECGSPDERKDFLNKACGDNAALRNDVESLLESNGASEAFFADDRHLWISAKDLYDSITHLQQRA